MKVASAGIGSFVPAVAAVAGSVALSLLILHPPPTGLLPGTAPADRGHVAALVLPAPKVVRPHAKKQLEAPRPTSTAIARVTAPRRTSRPAAPPVRHRTTPPPTKVVPTPAPQPVTQPVTTPVTTPRTTTQATATPANNGRWSSPTDKTWKAGATKQNTRVEKGKPPWAGQGNDAPTTTTVATTPAVAAPETATTPPGQDKVPPGQAKKGP